MSSIVEMESIRSTNSGPTRKRPSKGFRACWECKKRKTHGTSACTCDCSFGLGGLSGTGSVAGSTDEVHCPLHVGERLGKLEQLFEKFVCRKTPTVGTASTTPRSPTLVESSTEKSFKFFGLPKIASDAQSISTIGDGILQSQLGEWKSAPSIRTLVDSRDNGPAAGCDTVRRSLAALLPSQHDADVIFESTNGWTILQNVYKPPKELFVHQDPQSYALDMAVIAEQNPIIIARTLLHLAVCISSLPPEFQESRLTNIWSLEAAMQNYVSSVTSMVTSSDEHMSTVHGLETLLLLATYHCNSANLRQAWLINRRALSLAHLTGFHRIIQQKSTDPPIEAIERAKSIWRGLVDADCYLSFHLRLPFASDEYPCAEDADRHVLHKAQLAAISRQIAEIDRSVTPQTYVRALALDEKLESIMKNLSKDFWEVPNVPSTARSPESASVLERLVVQIWHFELKIFVHLPFLLRASTESRYEYSKITALQASRNAIMRWFALRNANITQACCRFSELGIFIATITLALDILLEMGTKEKSVVQRTRGSDFAMVCRVIGEMEKLAKSSPREVIAARSAVVIKKVLSSLDPSRQNAQQTRLTIPYFGTIELAYHKPPLRPTFDLDSDTGKKLNASTTGTHIPVFSFVSNELWPSPENEWEKDLNFDIILFDGLEDKDTEGNWVF